jgi:hypothetical protein
MYLGHAEVLSPQKIWVRKLQKEWDRKSEGRKSNNLFLIMFLI